VSITLIGRQLGEAMRLHEDVSARQAKGRALDLLRRWPNLVLLRTFSKVYGLAGLRVGLQPSDLHAEWRQRK